MQGVHLILSDMPAHAKCSPSQYFTLQYDTLHCAYCPETTVCTVITSACSALPTKICFTIALTDTAVVLYRRTPQSPTSSKND